MKKVSEITSSDMINWCKDFQKGVSHSHKLDNSNAALLVSLIMKEEELEKSLELQKKLLDECTMLQVINKRLKLYSYNLTFSAIIALGVILCKSFGQNTMNMTYLQYLSSKYKKSKINMEFLSMIAFPNGTFDEEFLNEMWNNQKIENIGISPDNMLDYPKFIDYLKF